MIKASELRKGKLVSSTMTFIRFIPCSCGQGQLALHQARLKNKTGQVIDAFNTDEVLETPFVENKPFECLYRDGDDVLMDQGNYDQIRIEGRDG